MNWLERWERLQRKNRRLVTRRNVRAYRKRQRQTGVRRIDLALTAEHYSFIRAAMMPGESISITVRRLLGSISGNTGQLKNGP